MLLPRCRCTTAPVIPEDFADGLRIARDEDGEEYYVPSEMKWREWKNGRKVGQNSIEKSIDFGVGSNKTDMKYINSDEYRTKFNAISDNPTLNHAIYKYCKAAVTHQSGDYFEDLTVLSTDGTLIGQTSSKERNITQYAQKLKTTVKTAKPYSLISIHNHGTNIPPSGADFASAGEKKHAFSIVACHNGATYYYSSTHSRPFLPSLIDDTVDKYMKSPYNLDRVQAAKCALDSISEQYGIEWRELT